MIKKLAKYMKGLWHLAIISALGMIIEAICELAMPSIANVIYNKVGSDASPQEIKADIIRLGIAMLCLAAVGLIGGL